MTIDFVLEKKNNEIWKKEKIAFFVTFLFLNILT